MSLEKAKEYLKKFNLENNIMEFNTSSATVEEAAKALKCEEKEIRDWSTIKSTVRENLRDYIFVKTKRNPMIIPIIMEV